VGKRVNEWGKGESSGATWAGHAAISSWYPFVVRFCVLISFEFLLNVAFNDYKYEIIQMLIPSLKRSINMGLLKKSVG